MLGCADWEDSDGAPAGSVLCKPVTFDSYIGHSGRIAVPVGGLGPNSLFEVEVESSVRSVSGAGTGGQKFGMVNHNIVAILGPVLLLPLLAVQGLCSFLRVTHHIEQV